MAVHGDLYLEDASSKSSKLLMSSFCSIITPLSNLQTILVKHTHFHATTSCELFIPMQYYIITLLFLLLAQTKTKKNAN